MKMLWLEGASGIAGDMTVGALLDLGADRAALDAALGSLGTGGFSYKIFNDKSHGIAGTRFDVHVHAEHGHAHGNFVHAHRHLAEIERIIAGAAMSERAKMLAAKAFRIVAEAEAKAHGCGIGEVHFHEVGAEDSIADIVGASVLFDSLGVRECVVDGLTEGAGTVVCAHGELPVPVPATLNIAAAHVIPLRRSAVRGELVTPTGIALAAAFRTRERLPESFRVCAAGIGLGTREIGRPNALRAVLLDEISAETPARVWQIETNIDDASGEMLAAAMEKIFAAGALDACFVPCFMKKNRPAYQLQAIAEESAVPAVEAAILRETTAIGLRRRECLRTCMAREMLTLNLPAGTVRAKRCVGAGVVRIYPEYEDVRALSERTGTPFAEIFAAAQAEAKRLQ